MFPHPIQPSTTSRTNPQHAPAVAAEDILYALFGGGLLGSYKGPTQDIGSGMQAVSSVMGGGMAPGSTATSRSNGQTVTSLPGGGYQRTSNKYGWTEITTADGRTTRAKSTRGAGGNYGGVQSGSVRDAMDKADKAGKSGVGSSGGLY